MNLQELRELAELLPPGGAVTLPREPLLEALAGAGVQTPGNVPAPDYTVAELAERFRRRPGTVRGWCEAGRFPGAYRLEGRAWRIPASGVAAFVDAQPTELRDRRQKLADWRAVRA